MSITVNPLRQKDFDELSDYLAANPRFQAGIFANSTGFEIPYDEQLWDVIVSGCSPPLKAQNFSHESAWRNKITPRNEEPDDAAKDIAQKEISNDSFQIISERVKSIKEARKHPANEMRDN